jgi:hypothetical protein
MWLSLLHQLPSCFNNFCRCMTGADGLPATKGLARAMGAAVLDHAQHLASRSPAASAAVLLAYLPDQQYAFLGKLEEGGQQEVLFKVLHALLGLADRLDQVMGEAGCWGVQSLNV